MSHVEQLSLEQASLVLFCEIAHLPHPDPSIDKRLRRSEKYMSDPYSNSLRLVVQSFYHDQGKSQFLVETIQRLLTPTSKIGGLTERDITIIKQRYGLIDGQIYTYKQISSSLGCSKERARKIVQRTLWKLRRKKPLSEFINKILSHDEGSSTLTPEL